MAGEKNPSSKTRLERIAEIAASGGYSLLSGKPELSSQGQSPMAHTEEAIREQTGFKIVVEFPQWQTDAVGIIGFHDELER